MDNLADRVGGHKTGTFRRNITLYILLNAASAFYAADRQYTRYMEEFKNYLQQLRHVQKIDASQKNVRFLELHGGLMREPEESPNRNRRGEVWSYEMRNDKDHQAMVKKKR